MENKIQRVLKKLNKLSRLVSHIMGTDITIGEPALGNLEILVKKLAVPSRKEAILRALAVYDCIAANCNVEKTITLQGESRTLSIEQYFDYSAYNSPSKKVSKSQDAYAIFHLPGKVIRRIDKIVDYVGAPSRVAFLRHVLSLYHAMAHSFSLQKPLRLVNDEKTLEFYPSPDIPYTVRKGNILDMSDYFRNLRPR